MPGAAVDAATESDAQAQARPDADADAQARPAGQDDTAPSAESESIAPRVSRPLTPEPNGDEAPQYGVYVAKTSSPATNEQSQPSEQSQAAPAREQTQAQSQAQASERRSNSNSSTSSPATRAAQLTKDTNNDDSTAAATYGTRSRHRGGPRPNYSDDYPIDVDTAPTNDGKSGMSRGAAAKNADNAVNGESVKPHNTILRLHTSATKSNGDATGSSSEQPRKKRKYERRNRDSDAKPSEADAGGIPGTSHFFVASTTESDAPPGKRRRIAAATGDASDKSRSISRRDSATAYNARLAARTTNIITFTKCGAIPNKDGKLEADDGTLFGPEDHVYLVCEPPGDPYYLCRLMEFRRANADDPKSPVVSILVNWYYRPKDIGRHHSDPRMVYASMQSDESPITSLRGKCRIQHRSEIASLEDYRRSRDSFWFSQLYDRYSHRPYEMLASSQVTNVPEKVKRALLERWRYIVVEQPRLRELTSAIKLCKRCNTYCAPDNSVDCGVCRETWHMKCVNPPLTKKPSRGFAWSCAPCSRAQERKLEQRHNTVVNVSSQSPDADRMDEEEEEPAEPEDPAAGTITDAPPESDENNAEEQADQVRATQTDMNQIQMWPWRYLGIHCRVEDVLQYDDRAIYPRASSRLGPRHQANVTAWFGQPVEFVQPVDVRKKFMKGANKLKEARAAKEAAKEAAAAAVNGTDPDNLDKNKRPRWVQDAPPGYIVRGEDHDPSDPDCTSFPIFVDDAATAPKRDSGFAAVNTRKSSMTREEVIDRYMDRARQKAEEWGLVVTSKKGDPQISTNYLDQALHLLYTHSFDADAAIQALEKSHSPKDLKNPDFSKEELKRFEDGVAKYGSELRSVRKYVKTASYGDIVRFYYTWKFSQHGSEIWGNHPGRRGAKRRADASWIEIANDDDDSAFDNDKAATKKRKFQCKFCLTLSTRRWRRAPNVAPGEYVLADPKGSARDKSNQLVVALCERCAILWRRYALKWEDPEELAKVISATSGRAWKRKNDEELLRELVHANEAAGVPTTSVAAGMAAQLGITVTLHADALDRRVGKGAGKTDSPAAASTTGAGTDGSRKKGATMQAREPTPPIVPGEPKFRKLPCAICLLTGPLPDPPLVCKECRLTVHRECYAASEQANPSKWICDTCLNDREQKVSLSYECALCPVANRQIDLVELPKLVPPKKKTDRDREKERLEKDLGQRFLDDYSRRQRSRGRPLYPREALKLTSSNNWMHITCAVWMPEIRFADSLKMEGAEGMSAIIASQARTDAVCKLCKIVQGCVVTCHQCHDPFHVACAHEAGYTFGFDVTPVKGSRKDAIPSATLGTESGSMNAVIWCKEHADSIKTVVHPMTERVQESGLTALQHYVQWYKQADLTLTGTARKANLLSQLTKSVTMNGAHVNGVTSRRASLVGQQPKLNGASPPQVNGNTEHSDGRQCVTCRSDISLKWHLLPSTSGTVDSDNDSVVSVVEARHETWQCHRCYTRQRRGLPPTEPHDADASATMAPLREPDLFEMTDPPSATQFSTAYQHPSVTPIPKLPTYPAAIEKFGRDLWEMRIEIRNDATGGKHFFKGRDFGLELDADPNAAWSYVQFFATQDCGYNREDMVIITEDGSWITFAKYFMQALVKMSVLNQLDALWKVENARLVKPVFMDETYRHVMQSHNLQWPPIYCPPAARELSRKSKYPPIPPPRKQPYLPPPPPISAAGTPGHHSTNVSAQVSPSAASPSVPYFPPAAASPTGSQSAYPANGRPYGPTGHPHAPGPPGPPHALGTPGGPGPAPMGMHGPPHSHGHVNGHHHPPYPPRPGPGPGPGAPIAPLYPSDGPRHSPSNSMHAYGPPGPPPPPHAMQRPGHVHTSPGPPPHSSALGPRPPPGTPHGHSPSNSVSVQGFHHPGYGPAGPPPPGHGYPPGPPGPPPQYMSGPEHHHHHRTHSHGHAQSHSHPHSQPHGHPHAHGHGHGHGHAQHSPGMHAGSPTGGPPPSSGHFMSERNGPPSGASQSPSLRNLMH